MNMIIGLKNAQLPTHNIKQLGFSGLRGFSSRTSVFLGGYERTPKSPNVLYCQPSDCLKTHFQNNKKYLVFFLCNSYIMRIFNA